MARRLLGGSFLVFALALGIASFTRPTAIFAQDASPAACPTTTAEENMAIVQQYLDALSAGDEAAIDALLHDDLVHNLSRGGMTVPNEPGNADELELYRNAGGNATQYTVDDMFSGDDNVAVRFTFSVAAEAIAGSTATEAVQATGIALVRIECGMIAELWAESDGVTILLGHGYTIEQGGAAATPTS